MNNRTSKDWDGLEHRLLLFMKKSSGLPFTQIKRIKQGVWRLTSQREHWILKEFPSKSKLVLQIALTNELFSHGFTETYTFIPKPFTMEDRVFGLLKYIKPKIGIMFDYDQDSNIRDALTLLTKFHQTTSQFIPSFKGQIPDFPQLLKWERRLDDFNRSIHIHKTNKAYSHLNRLSKFGEWALEEMFADDAFFQKKPHCIIHGDVASHNFIRKRDGTLYMIDFDLISIAPSYIDLLQMCSRILPAINWDVDRLFNFDPIKNYKEVRPFLAALVFPTDIFREWNQFMRWDETEQRLRWPMVEKITFRQYKQRILFYEKIIERVESIQ